MSTIVPPPALSGPAPADDPASRVADEFLRVIGDWVYDVAAGGVETRPRGERRE